MQPDRFTVKSQEAVAAAQALAAERRNSEVTPSHLLVALLRQEEGIAVPILQKLNVDVGPLDCGGRGGRRGPSEARRDRGGAALLDPRRGPPGRREGDGQARRQLPVGGTPPARAGRLGLGDLDLLPERGALEKAVAEVQGPAASPPPTPR